MIQCLLNAFTNIVKFVQSMQSLLNQPVEMWLDFRFWSHH